MTYITNPVKPDGRTAYTIADLVNMAATTDDPEHMAELWEQVEVSGTDLREHIDTILAYLRDLGMTVAGIDSEMKRLQELKQSRTNRIAQLENILNTWMEAIETSEIVTDLHTVRRKRNPFKVDVIDPAAIPAEFMREKVTTEPDKKAIKDALQAGVPVDGCRLIQQTRLEIK